MAWRSDLSILRVENIPLEIPSDSSTVTPSRISVPLLVGMAERTPIPHYSTPDSTAVQEDQKIIPIIVMIDTTYISPAI